MNWRPVEGHSHQKGGSTSPVPVRSRSPGRPRTQTDGQEYNAGVIYWVVSGSCHVKAKASEMNSVISSLKTASTG